MECAVRISAALASHNSRRHIQAQLDSVLTQTVAPAEVVISDDGSTDGTLDILAEYAARDPRVRVIHNEDRSENPINRNFENAARHCRGEWIAFCDHDDVWYPEKLQVLLANREGVDLVYGRSELIGESGRPMGVSAEAYLKFPGFFSSPVPIYVLLDTNTVAGHAMIVRRAVVEAALPFPSGEINYDHWLALVALARRGIRFIDRPIVRHRIHARNSVHRLHEFRERRRPPAAERYRKRIARHLEAIVRLAPFRDGLDPADRDFLPAYEAHLRRWPDCYFDFRYLLEAFPIHKRKRLYHRNALWRLIGECRGGRCFRVLGACRV